MKPAGIAMSETFQIDFEPLGRRITARAGQTLLAAAQMAGVGLASVCGGVGTCEECRVRLVTGKLTDPTQAEQDALGEAGLAANFRLACQAEPSSDVKLDVPPESLTSPQRLQLEGDEIDFAVRLAITTPGACGLAVDIGTTKLAAYLVELATGRTLAKAGAMNPQVAYGEDVISRIAFANRKEGDAAILQSILANTLNTLLADMCWTANIDPSQVCEAVLVGNTAMHHLFAGLPVEQLGHAPFSPVSTLPLTCQAADLGLQLALGATVYLPPVVAGYVGSDHISMLLATQAWRSSRNLVAIDIGTNTEIALVVGGKVTCCSCASGPAFEGAHIREGMRAAPGAIERVRWSNGEYLWQTIDNVPPVGICGSGILDMIAAMQDGELLKPTGTFQPGFGPEIVLVPANRTSLGRDLVITRKDVHEIQLAKSAIRTGIEILLQNAGMTFSDLDEFIVAGAFGTYLDLRSAVRVGMFPPLPLACFRQVGNAAGVGAKQMLLSVDKRAEAELLAMQMNYVELTNQASFTPLFMKYLLFES